MTLFGLPVATWVLFLLATVAGPALTFWNLRRGRGDGAQDSVPTDGGRVSTGGEPAPNGEDEA